MIDLKQKNVTFTLDENGFKISLSHKKLSDKKLYNVSFFQDYFDRKSGISSAQLDNYLESYQEYKAERHQEKVTPDVIKQAYEEFEKNWDAFNEFEVERTDHQIEKLVDEGI